MPSDTPTETKTAASTPAAEKRPAGETQPASGEESSGDEGSSGKPAAAEARSASDEESAAPRRSRLRGRSFRPLTVASTGLFALALFYTLYFAAGFFLPVVIAMMLNMLFRPVVRALRRVGLPDPLGAALVMLVLLGSVGYGLYALSGPAARWAERAPEYLRDAETELRGLFEPVQSVSESAAQVGEQIAGTDDAEGQPPPVPVQQNSFSDVLLGQTRQFVVGAAITCFLLYFLLASGDFFLRKLVHVLPMLRRKRIAVRIARQAEHDLSTYLFTYTVINAVLGTVVGAVLYLLGMPNPVLWGVMVALLNFVPYLGAVTGVSIVALAALVSIDSPGRALAAPALYFLINALEGNVITPIIMGQRLRLNPVAIFISLTFWGWLWGVAGALLATPLLVSLKIVCDNVATLHPLGEFIGR